MTRPDWLASGDLQRVFDSPTTAAHYREVTKRMVTREDRQAFRAACGFPLSLLLDSPWWARASATQLMEVMSATKVLAHPLNALGLQALRALLAERIMRHIEAERGATSDDWYEALVRDGIVEFTFVHPAPLRWGRPLWLPRAQAQRLTSLLARLSSA